MPVVGSVMRDRTFRSVDLPAPLRPTTPTTSPRSTSKDTSLSAQNHSDDSRRLPRIRSKGAAIKLDQRLGESTIRLRLMRDAIALADAIDSDGGVAHQMTSAKLRSVRRKYASPPTRSTRLTAVAMITSATGAPMLEVERAQRKPSMTPAMGFR